jgi:hypothetical protein
MPSAMRAGRTLAVPRAPQAEREIAAGEDRRAAEKAQSDRPEAAMRLMCALPGLVHQIERQRRDQHPRAKPHDRRDGPA